MEKLVSPDASEEPVARSGLVSPDASEEPVARSGRLDRCHKAQVRNLLRPDTGAPLSAATDMGLSLRVAAELGDEILGPPGALLD
jgi:hypothetical protein